MVPFSFAHQEFRLGASRALFWAEENALLVADLHLEKASFFARHGQMLPPYDSRATLERLAQAVKETGARRVFCLGDSFHDSAGVDRLEPHAAGMLMPSPAPQTGSGSPGITMKTPERRVEPWWTSFLRAGL